MGAGARLDLNERDGRAIAGAKAELASESLNDRLLALGKDDEIEMVLQQIKTRKGITG